MVPHRQVLPGREAVQSGLALIVQLLSGSSLRAAQSAAVHWAPAQCDSQLQFQGRYFFGKQHDGEQRGRRSEVVVVR